MRGGLIAALDVGSSKVCCAIAQIQSGGSFEILGFAQQLSSGVKSGIIIDMEEVITSIVNAVHGASQLAGVREVATMILGKNIRLGKPIHLMSHELSQNPAFSTCAGLLSYGEIERTAYLQTRPQTISKRVATQVVSLCKKIW
jgi:cell division ATPase FtsA